MISQLNLLLRDVAKINITCIPVPSDVAWMIRQESLCIYSSSFMRQLFPHSDTEQEVLQDYLFPIKAMTYR